MRDTVNLKPCKWVLEWAGENDQELARKGLKGYYTIFQEVEKVSNKDIYNVNNKDVDYDQLSSCVSDSSKITETKFLNARTTFEKESGKSILSESDKFKSIFEDKSEDRIKNILDLMKRKKK